MTESLDTIAARIQSGFKHDERIRELETGMAEVKTVLASLPSMEQRLIKAIEENKPKSPWPAVSALAGLVGVALVLAAAIYGGR